MGYALLVSGAPSVTTCAPATVADRNAGSNPQSYTASATALGGTLDATVDLTTTGQQQALHFAVDTAVEITLGGGQTLLCIDSGGSGELLGQGFQNGPQAVFSMPIPNDPSLCGTTVYSQALHAFGIPAPFAHSNA